MKLILEYGPFSDAREARRAAHALRTLGIPVELRELRHDVGKPAIVNEQGPVVWEKEAKNCSPNLPPGDASTEAAESVSTSRTTGKQQTVSWPSLFHSDGATLIGTEADVIEALRKRGFVVHDRAIDCSLTARPGPNTP